MMVRYGYNSQIQPPAPFVHVIVRHPLTGADVRDLPAQLDPAADRTLLPLHVVQALALPAIGSTSIGGVGGTVATMTLYAVEIGISTFATRLLEVVAHPGESWILLGRDLLNAHRLLLDGPQLALEVD